MEIADINEADMANLKEQGYSESDLALLHPDEVKALLPIISTDESDGDPHADAMREQDEAAAAAAAATESAAADAAETSHEPAAQERAQPQAPAPMPADLAEQIKTLKSEEKAAFKRLMDGEIESDAYQEIKDRVEDEVDALKDQAAAARRQMEDAQREWLTAEAAAMTAAKTEGLDYRAKPALLAAFNTHLRALGSDPKNEKRDAKWFLSEAHRLTKEDLGFVAAKQKPAPSTPRGVDNAEIPPTLRNAPVAASGAVNTDEFAHMRRLEGVELERAHAALTDAQRDRWMNS